MFNDTPKPVSTMRDCYLVKNLVAYTLGIETKRVFVS